MGDAGLISWWQCPERDSSESSDTKTASSWGNLPAPKRASLSSVPRSPAAVHPHDEQIRWFFLASSGRGSPRSLLHFYSCEMQKANRTTYSPAAAADLKATLIMTMSPLLYIPAQYSSKLSRLLKGRKSLRNYYSQKEPKGSWRLLQYDVLDGIWNREKLISE